MKDTLTAPQGEFQLARYPERRNETLRAWNAADTYLLQELNDSGLLLKNPRLLIVNDSFGALSVPLAPYRPEMLSDSFLAHRGVENNLKKNDLAIETVTLLTSLQEPEHAPDVVLIKIPKTLALLEDQLHRIRPHLRPSTRILGAGMVKHIHTSTLQMFERIIGPVKTSLARQKARLIHCCFDPELNPGESPYPTRYRLAGSRFQLTNHANLFSREQLDIGTRLFLDQIPASAEAKRIVDLGCGNGVIGLIAAERNPQAEIVFIDESFMAVASAETNFRAAFGSARNARFLAGHCLEGIPQHSIDLILNNPPFHQQSAVGDQIAWEMFHGSRHALRADGALLVVGNRHMAYHAKLKRLFGNCQVLASNRKFVVLEARHKKPEMALPPVSP